MPANDWGFTLYITILAAVTGAAGGSFVNCLSWRLVRGQKVVAIGSPLGLFNTVSDGIISGFRTVGERSMIQFTAPTSHGSSGGALLDLYGNLIGIITAGFDDGQNLNLAVDYKAILDFTRGIL